MSDLPAKLVRVPRRRGKPSVRLEQRGEGHVTPASEVWEISGPAPEQIPVEDGAPVALSDTVMPYQARLATILEEYRKKLAEQTYPPTPAQLAYLYGKHLGPLFKSDTLESKEPHARKIP